MARPAPPPPRPAPRVAPAPAPKPKPVQAARPQPAPRPATARPAANPPRNAGASSFADAFKRGVPGAQAKGQSQNQAAATPSTQLMSSWASSIGSRVVRPWNVCAPDGADAEKLRIMVRFTLDRTGGVASMDDPVVSGQTDANRPQVDRYKECAIRAIRSSAPFPGLPPEYYDHWKSRRLNFRKE
jgi:outer membrane biosynthesis protein TonB